MTKVSYPLLGIEWVLGIRDTMNLSYEHRNESKLTRKLSYLWGTKDIKAEEIRETKNISIERESGQRKGEGFGSFQQIVQAGKSYTISSQCFLGNWLAKSIDFYILQIYYFGKICYNSDLKFPPIYRSLGTKRNQKNLS